MNLFHTRVFFNGITALCVKGFFSNVTDFSNVWPNNKCSKVKTGYYIIFSFFLRRISVLVDCRFSYLFFVYFFVICVLFIKKGQISHVVFVAKTYLAAYRKGIWYLTCFLSVFTVWQLFDLCLSLIIPSVPFMHLGTCLKLTSLVFVKMNIPC